MTLLRYISVIIQNGKVGQLCCTKLPVKKASRGFQHLEWQNVGQPIFRNFQISNIKITKNELLDFLFSNLFFNFFIR